MTYWFFEGKTLSDTQSMLKGFLKDSKHKLFATLEKCVFDLQWMGDFGYRISTEYIQMDPLELQAILSQQLPQNVKDFMVFLIVHKFADCIRLIY